MQGRIPSTHAGGLDTGRCPTPPTGAIISAAHVPGSRLPVSLPPPQCLADLSPASRVEVVGRGARSAIRVTGTRHSQLFHQRRERCQDCAKTSLSAVLRGLSCEPGNIRELYIDWLTLLTLIRRGKDYAHLTDRE